MNRATLIGLWLMLCIIAADRATARSLPYWAQDEKSTSALKAEKALKKQLLRQYQNDPELVSGQLMAAGWVLIARGGPNTAIKRFNEAALFRPDDPNIPHGIMIAMGQRGDEPEAIAQAYARALSLAPSAAISGLHRDFGQVMLSLGHQDEALNAFRASLAGGRAEAGVLLCIARLFYAQGSTEVARLYFNWAERVVR